MRAPVCSAMMAPNGIATRQVGRIDTLATNQSWWTNSRHWTGRRNAARTVSRDMAAKLPASRNTHFAGIVVIGALRPPGPQQQRAARGTGWSQDVVDHAPE